MPLLVADLINVTKHIKDKHIQQHEQHCDSISYYRLPTQPYTHATFNMPDLRRTPLWQRLVQRPCDAFLYWARRPCNRTDEALCAEMRKSCHLNHHPLLKLTTLQLDSDSEEEYQVVEKKNVPAPAQPNAALSVHNPEDLEEIGRLHMGLLRQMMPKLESARPAKPTPVKA